jgi:hypothetical protein
MSDDLARFVRATVEHMEGRGPNPNEPRHPDNATYGGGDEGFGSGAPPGYRTPVELDDDTVIDADVLEESAEQGYEEEAADEPSAEEGDDEPIRTGRDFVGYVLGIADDAGMIELEDGSTMGAADYLAAIAAVSASEWHSWALEQGFDPESRPAEVDEPRDMQSARIADRFSDRLAAVKEAEAEGRPRANIPYL